MRSEMSSRQRILRAFNHSEVDHVPLLVRWWSRQYLSNKNDSWKDQFERVLKTTKLGLDDAVEFEPPRMFNPEVTVKVRRESRPGERYQVLFKEYHAPNGVLSQVACKTDDWPHGGAPLNMETAKSLGADGYGRGAVEGANIYKQWAAARNRK